MRRGSIHVLLLLVPVLSIAGEAGQTAAREPALRITVGKPPSDLILDPFYEKYADAEGIPVVSSRKVPDKALIVAAELVENVLAGRPDLRKALVESGARVAVMSKDEVMTDIPEHSRLKPAEYWDKRARGLGGIPTSCGEENLLGYPDDRYNGESILIHEFAHTVHEIGMKVLDKEFDGRLRKLYNKAMEEGLWKKTYAATNYKEYWAEGVQSYFNSNRQADPPDGVHNHVRTREQLQKYDPDLARLIDEVFTGNPWRWSPNGAHGRKWQKTK